MNKHVRWIVNKWMTQKWFLLIMLLFTLGSSAVAIAHPIVFGRLIDLLKGILASPDKYPEPMAEVNRIIWIMLGLGAAQLVTGFYPAVRGWVNIRFENMLRMFYFKFILGKDFRFFQKFRTGDVVTRLTDDLTDYSKISWFMCSGIFRAVNSFSLIMFTLAVMFSISPKLTLLSIAPLPLMMVVFYFTSDKLYRNFELNQQAISEINSQLEMSFSGIRIVKAFVSEEKYNRFFDLARIGPKRSESETVCCSPHLSRRAAQTFPILGLERVEDRRGPSGHLLNKLLDDRVQVRILRKHGIKERLTLDNGLHRGVS